MSTTRDSPRPFIHHDRSYTHATLTPHSCDQSQHWEADNSHMLRTSAQRIARRNFSTSPTRLGHGPDGPYSNLPWKVHNRRVPYWVLHFGFFAVGLGTPFAITFYHLKKAGNI